MDSLYIVMPAYNEAENIEAVVEEWYPLIEQYGGDGRSRLVVVNDGSTDGTGEAAGKLRDRYPHLVVLNKKNSGHGPTVLYAYRYALHRGADYVFQTDSDGQTSPEEFHEFWKRRNHYDAVIGDRQAGRQDGEGRIFVEKVVCLLVRAVFGVHVPDANAPFRLMNADLLRKYLPMLPKNAELPNIILTALFVRGKEKVCFRRITFAPRRGGENSINYRKITQIGNRAVFDFVKIRRRLR